MKVTLKLTAACGQTSCVGKVLMSRMIRSEGGERGKGRACTALWTRLNMLTFIQWIPIMSYTLKALCSIQLSQNRHMMVHDWHHEGYESVKVIVGSFKKSSVS